MQSEYVCIDRNFYHECILERGDTLEDVCQHFGYEPFMIMMMQLNEGFRVSYAFVLDEPNFSGYDDNPPPIYIPADSGPSGGRVSVAVSPIETYCLKIQDIEIAAAISGISLEPQNLVTYIRKLYYFGNLWDAIIPGARRINMPESLRNDQSVQSAIEYMVNHQVLPIDGRSVDIGHVFAGLDTRHYIESNFDLSVTVNETLGLRIPVLNFVDNFSLATWSADLGSIVVNYHNRTLRWAREYSEYYDNWMPPKDIRSDADSYIFSPFPLSSGQTLSSQFRNFYMGSSSPRIQRFQNFRQAINSDSPQWRQQAIDDVIDSAIGFAAMGDGGRHRSDVLEYLVDFLSGAPRGISTGTRDTYRSLAEQVIDSFKRQIEEGESAIPLTPSLRGLRLQ